MSALVTRLEALLSVRRWVEAEACARDLIAQYPDWGAAYTHLARALDGQKRYEEALEAAQVGVHKAPHDCWAHGIVSMANERLERYHEAIAAANEALRLCPTYAFALALLSFNYDKIGKPRKALEATSTGLKHHPHDQELLRYHAFNLYRANRLKEAEQVARACLRLHPTSHEALNVLGMIAMLKAGNASFYRVRLHRQAHDFFLQALRLRPTLEHIQANARDNAVQCRSYVWNQLIWIPYLFLVGICTGIAVYLITRSQVGIFATLLIVLTGMFLTGGEKSMAFFLAHPILDRWKLPSVALPEHQAGYRTWRYDMRVVFTIPVVLCLLCLVVCSMMGDLRGR